MTWLLYDHCKNGYRHKRNIYGKIEKSGDDSYKREKVDTAVSGEFMGRQRQKTRGNVQEEFLWQDKEEWKRCCYVTPQWTHRWLMMMSHLEVECHILDPAQRAVW